MIAFIVGNIKFIVGLIGIFIAGCICIRCGIAIDLIYILYVALVWPLILVIAILITFIMYTVKLVKSLIEIYKRKLK